MRRRILITFTSFAAIAVIAAIVVLFYGWIDTRSQITDLDEAVAAIEPGPTAPAVQEYDEAALLDAVAGLRQQFNTLRSQVTTLRSQEQQPESQPFDWIVLEKNDWEPDQWGRPVYKVTYQTPNGGTAVWQDFLIFFEGENEPAAQHNNRVLSCWDQIMIGSSLPQCAR